MDKTTLNIEGDQRLVLVEAYTNPVKGESHHAPTYAYKWILNKASAFSEKVVGLGFDEVRGTFKAELEDGTLIVEHNGNRYIYKPYAKAREVYYKQD